MRAIHGEFYNSAMPKLTRLAELRKAAPGSLTGAKLAEFFRKKRCPRSLKTILNFERGQYAEPTDRFLEVYAEAIGQPVAVVRRAFEQVRRSRRAGTGPFGNSMVSLSIGRSKGKLSLDHAATNR